MQTKEQNDLVSVIVPCYNTEKYVKTCIESIINQTYKNLEVVLVNDCSKDGTLEILNEYARIDNRITIVNNTVNSGASPSRENGYNNSHGEWICFIDSDDALNPKAIEIWMSEADESVDILAGKFKRIDEKEFEKYVWQQIDDIKSKVFEHEEIMKHLGIFAKMEVSDSTWGKIFRRCLFEKSNAFQYKEEYPLTYFEDTVLTPSLLVVGRKMKIIDEYLYLYREVSNSMSHANGSDKIEITWQRLLVFDKVLDWYDYNQSFLFAIECELLQAIKLWYLLRKYYGKNSKKLAITEKIFRRF